MTYSICAVDPENGDLGVAVQTHQPAVGSVVPWVTPSVGAVATQATANVDFGPRVLAMLELGLNAELALQAVLSADPLREIRQLAVVDILGNAAAFTGNATMAYAGHQIGEGNSVQSNMMRNDTVPAAMATDFESSKGPLAMRLFSALRAAQGEGGDIRGMQSAALIVRPSTRQRVDPTWDLRVDNDPEPLNKLEYLINLRRASERQRELNQIGKTVEERSSVGAECAVPRETVIGLIEQIQTLDNTDETLFWLAVTLSNIRAELDLAVELLTPLFERAPQWRILLHRLRPPHRSDALAERFPRSD